MKKLYSCILLFSFLTGVIQPVLPMVEVVYTAEGNLASLLSSVDAEFCSLSCDTSDHDACEKCDYPDSDTLLDIEFYPIPLQVAEYSGTQILYKSTGLYSGGDDKLILGYYSTIPPPPKFA